MGAQQDAAAAISKAATPGSRHPKAYIATSGGVKCVLPFAPQEVDHGGWADTWDTLDRPGRVPLTVRSGNGLYTMQFTALIAGRDHQTSVEPHLAVLRAIAGSGQAVGVSLGPSERGAWVLDGIKTRSLMRQSGTNAITRAEVTFSFLRYQGVSLKAGPVTGSKPKPKAPKRAALWYVFRKGDTLSKLAVRYFGDADAWRKIAGDAHNRAIRNPNRIAVGQRVYIPAA